MLIKKYLCKNCDIGFSCLFYVFISLISQLFLNSIAIRNSAKNYYIFLIFKEYFLSLRKISLRKISFMDNPFKFGSLVDAPYFTDRVKELDYIVQFLKSENHLILISPRRFGKSSLVKKAVKQTERPYIWLNMQSVLSKEDFAAKLLKALLNEYKLEKLKYYLRNFHVVPSVNMNPMTDEFTVSFQPSTDNGVTALEDVMDMLQKVSTPDRKLIVVLDEFQSILEIDKHLDRQLRAIMQEQVGINYIFLGSQESMMTDIFENVKSPFYHFGMLMRLSKIPYNDFKHFLTERLAEIGGSTLADEILSFTGCHPYYTQELAFAVWNNLAVDNQEKDVIHSSIEDIITIHDLDYERLWLNFNKTDKYVMVVISEGSNPVQDRKLPTSTLTSATLRLSKKGYIIRTEQYEIEDPFFKEWILKNVVRG